MGALAKKQAEEAAAAAATAASASAPAPVEPSRPSEVAPYPAPQSLPAESQAPPPSGSSLGGVALAAAIFGIAVLAWHSAPWRAPQRTKIDPESLKLDRSFILDRPSPKGTTSPSRPS